MAKGNYWKQCCRCDTCIKVRQDCWFRGLSGECGLCGRNDLSIVPFLPEVVKSILQVERLCNGCRNCICSYVSKRFGLCFASDSDDSIGMAICAMIRSNLASAIFMAERPEFFTDPKYCRTETTRSYRKQKLDV